MRYLALDLGDRRIGVAVSDTLGIVARPLEVYLRRSRVEDAEHVRALVRDHKVDALIIGLPLNMDGSEGSQAHWVRDYVEELSGAIGLPTHLWDERLSTNDAKAIMRSQGKTPDKEWVDAVAAAVILQSYLDAQA